VGVFETGVDMGMGMVQAYPYSNPPHTHSHTRLFFKIF